MLNRRNFIFAIALVVVASGLHADDEPRDSKTRLKGVWVAEKVTSSGNTVPAKKFPFELHFADDKLIFKRVSGKDRVHQIVVDRLGADW